MYPVQLFASSLGLLLGLFSPLPSWADEIVPNGYRNIANEYQIPPKVLYAVALTESGRSDSTGTVRPWPWTLNVRGRGFFYCLPLGGLKPPASAGSFEHGAVVLAV